MQQPIFPGKFDPFHLGHQSLLEQALTLFKQVTIAVCNSKQLHTMFTTQTRSNIIAINTNPERVKIISFSGLLTQLMSQNKIYYLIRGIRNQQDAQHELDLIYNYQLLYQQESKLNTHTNILPILFPALQKYQHISSSIIRDIIQLDNNYSKLRHLLSQETIQYLITNPKINLG